MPNSSERTTAPSTPNMPNISLEARTPASDPFLSACLSWVTRQAMSGSLGSQDSKDAAAESYLTLLLAMNGFKQASGILLGACLRSWGALVEEGPQGSAAIQRSAVQDTAIRDEDGLTFGHALSQGAQRTSSVEARTTPHEPKGEHPLYASIPATQSRKLQRYLEELDAASRTNLERHLKNPAVSSTTICDSLRGNGFIVGRTTIKEYRRQMAGRIRS